MSEEQNNQEELQKQCEEYLAGWKRALADYDNLKKDLAREKTDMRQRVMSEAAHALLPVMDNFDQAAKFLPVGLDDQAKQWLAGVMHVRTQIEDVMRSLGAEPYGAVGEAFDPNLHESGGEKEVEGAEPHSVVEVVTRGWKMGSRILRPAKVIIAK